MNLILAMNNVKIFNELKMQKNINIINNDIQYKEGIIEILEKNNNIDFVIINENLGGQIKIEELIKKIKNKNNKINIIIILNKKDVVKEEYLIKNKIKFVYNENLSAEKISEIIFNKNKVIGIIGNRGSGKTITTLILSELMKKHNNKKILIIKNNAKKNIKNKTDQTKEIEKQKNTYNYIFIEIKNIKEYEYYKKIIDETILILNPNILEINKIKKYIINNKIKTKIILNYYNENSISQEIIKNIFKSEVIAKIEYNSKYNLITNNNFNINYLDKKTEKIFLDIIRYL